MSIGIYKIENKINHKCYIGQSIDIEHRWKEHLWPCIYANPFHASYNNAIYRAFRKYGVENFSFSIIEQCDKINLDEREKYWIAYYNSYYNGYNMTIGGQGSIRISNVPVYCYSIEGDFIQGYNNIREASEKTNTQINSIYNVVSGKHTLANGYQWSYIKTDKIKNGFNFIPVIAFNLNGEKVKIFPSISQAIKETGDSYNSIKKSCDTKHHSGKNYQWRYWFENPELIQIEPYKWSATQAVDQYDLEGNYIKTFESLTVAANTLQLSVSNLTACCKKRQKSFGGFQWCYHNEELSNLYIDLKYNHTTSSNKKRVLQFNKNKEFINSFESAHEAARQICKPKCANHITECCQGKRKTCEGYIWKYQD